MRESFGRGLALRKNRFKGASGQKGVKEESKLPPWLQALLRTDKG